MTEYKILKYRCGTFLAHQKGAIKMTENKTCFTCKHRDVEFNLTPCNECIDLSHDFQKYTKWEPRDKK